MDNNYIDNLKWDGVDAAFVDAPAFYRFTFNINATPQGKSHRRNFKNNI
jgi:hypothetical protein